ncbi:hypothetical protein CEV31_2932 [Brucella thiophenivorans]|uniref:Uncharacterized protein n=1 Tax=Brucella thiophenivorans TaxID=571255 RepID=A0A256FJM8_9HYPH|nr:hypothetical protein CEV31_2932 [Brucella thiophenivorans]
MVRIIFPCSAYNETIFSIKFRYDLHSMFKENIFIHKGKDIHFLSKT